jgi:hypothetical protein
MGVSGARSNCILCYFLLAKVNEPKDYRKRQWAGCVGASVEAQNIFVQRIRGTSSQTRVRPRLRALIIGSAAVAVPVDRLRQCRRFESDGTDIVNCQAAEVGVTAFVSLRLGARRVKPFQRIFAESPRYKFLRSTCPAGSPACPPERGQVQRLRRPFPGADERRQSSRYGSREKTERRSR